MSHPRRDGAGWPEGNRRTTTEDAIDPTEQKAIDIVELSGADLEDADDGPTFAVPGKAVGLVGEEDVDTDRRVAPETPPPAADYGPPAEEVIDPLGDTHAPESVAVAGSFEGAAPSTPFGGDMVPDTDRDLEAEPTRIESDIPGMEVIPAPAAKLEVIGGNDRGKEFPLHDGDNSLGRGLDNDIVLADIAVSRKHTLICKENDQYVVRDLGSGNGTLVNSKKIHTHLLADGDQLEVGNTLLRFVGAVVPLAEAATMIGQVDDIVPLASGDPLATVDVDHAPAPVSPKRRRFSRRQKLLILGGGGLVVFFGLLIGLKLFLKRDSQPDAKKAKPDVTQLAAKHFDEGRKQLLARNWEKARRHYLRVFALAPGFEEAKRYADQAAAEMKARDALKAAKNALKAKDYRTARAQLVKIPSTSVYAAAQRKLKQEVDDKEVSELLAAARSLEESGDRDGALAKVDAARRIAPTNQVVKDLHAQLSGDDTKGGKVVAKRPQHGRKHHGRKHTPRKGGSGRPRPIRVSGSAVRRALAKYGRRDWSGAHTSLSEHAAKLKGRRRKRVERLAKTIKAVGKAISAAERSQASSPAKAIRLFQKALKLDRKVKRAPHQKAIKRSLYRVARAYANSAFAANRYAASFAAYKMAKRYGAVDSSLKEVMKRLSKKAGVLFTQGYTLKKKNPKRAQRLWKTVLRMVPPSDPAYKKAYEWLNNSGPRYQDEDED